LLDSLLQEIVTYCWLPAEQWVKRKQESSYVAPILLKL